MLKGTATIELTDVRTGQKEVVKHDNLVTHAIRDLLTLNPFGMRFRSHSKTENTTNNANNTDMAHELGASFEDGMLPLCPKAIGGILLYGDTLEEDPDKYYAPMSNPLVGYSSNDASDTQDIRRGSMNLTESGPLEDGNGYRFVFDFRTSEANGTISAVALTSERGGKAGYGSPYDKVGYPMLVVDAVKNSEADSILYWIERTAGMKNLVAMDPEKNIIYFAKVTGKNSISVGKMSLPVNTLGLVKNTAAKPQVISTNSITTEDFATQSHSKQNPDYVPGDPSSGKPWLPIDYMGKSRKGAFCGTFLDGGDGYIWGFQHLGNAPGGGNVLWVKISKESLELVAEGEWELSASLFPLGVSEYNEVPEGENPTHSQMQHWNNAVIKDGRLYALRESRMGVYSINLEDPTDIVYMPAGFEIYVNAAVGSNNFNGSTKDEYAVANTNVIDIGCAILYRNAYINGGKIWPLGYGTKRDTCMGDSTAPYSKNFGLRYNPMTSAHYGPFFLNYYSYYYHYSGRDPLTYNYPVVWLRTPYLATINNLDKPVEKTADKTMKITYTLREEAATNESDQQADPALG